MALVRPLGDLELLVMQRVWCSAPTTAREVHDAFTGNDQRAYTTIMTTLDRLFHKGLLTRERVGAAWQYEPLQARADYERSLAIALAEQIVDAHGEVGLAAFVDAAACSDELLDRLAWLIEARRRR